ncbi:lipopolysaccharide biosynthesis protein, partial [Rubripirellula amarantea]|nr:lipopolysaccharide biosynthesis protein [Rubripirellula amarantea]
MQPQEKIRRDTIRGFGWSFLSQFGVQFARLTTLIVLARFFVGPAEFGLVNMFVVFTGFSQILIDFGFTNALIQKQDATQQDYSSVFWLNLAICIVISCGLMMGSPWIASFYNAPALTPIAMAMSPVYVLYGLTSLQRVLLRKKLDFRTISMIEVVSVCISGLLACGAALLGLRVWSLVVFYLTAPLTSSLIYWLQPGSWRPTFSFSLDSLKSLSKFGLSMLGNNSLNYWARNIDKVFIGRYLGETQLGFYNQAYSLVLIPVTNFSNTFVSVMFPAFSKMQKDNLYVSKMFTGVSQTVLAVNLPIFLYLSIAAKDFVLILLGQDWEPIVAPLRVFAFIGLFISMRTIHSSVFMSHNRNGTLLKINLVSRTIMIAGYFFLVQYGILAVAYWLLLSIILSFAATAACS